jgi:DNA-binding NtrC family response regulator
MPNETDDASRRNRLTISRGGTVLVVDEDSASLNHYRAILLALGYQVEICASYEEGVRRLDADALDFIVVSQGSPEFEGRWVLERAIQIDRRLPVLARCLDMGCYLEAMQAGAVDYLAEPISVRDLLSALETHLRPARKEPPRRTTSESNLSAPAQRF